jgi:hypothetical protein
MKHDYLNNTNAFSSLSFDCAPCKLGKNKYLPFPLQGSCAFTCFAIIHSDVWGMSHVLSHAHYRYFVTFINDYNRFTWVYFLRSKAVVFSTFQTFIAYVEIQISTCIKILCSNSGGESCLMLFNLFSNRRVFFLSVCILTPLNRMVLPSVRIVIF